MAVEEEQTRQLLERIETLEQLLGVVRAELAGSAPVRHIVAAVILKLTEKTVRDWRLEGVLTLHQHRPRLLLDANRLHRVSHLVADLRRAGRKRGLLDEVYRRLADDALAGRGDLAESLAEMRLGEGQVVRSEPTTP